MASRRSRDRRGSRFMVVFARVCDIVGLREFAGANSASAPLDPFSLARYANLLVVAFEDVKALLTEETISRLTGDGKGDWSGGACSQPLPNGQKLIILNPTHGERRQRATLMEEISHVFMGHKPSRLHVEQKDKKGRVRARDYNREIEEEAYAIGAAALVPYAGLVRLMESGMTSRSIADHFNVSYQLVEYRLKVSKLWDKYLEIQGTKTGL